MQETKISLVQQMRVLYKEEEKLYREYAAQCNLSVAGFWVMYAIYQMKRPCYQQEIGEDAVFYSKQTVHSAIQKLIEMDYVEKTTWQKKQAWQLTKTGALFSEQKIQPFHQAMENALFSLGEKGSAQYINSFQKFLDSLKTDLKKQKAGTV